MFFLSQGLTSPAYGIVRIEGVVAAEVQVYNALGQVVKTIHDSNEINVSGLLGGVYVLRITATDGTTHTARMVVQQR